MSDHHTSDIILTFGVGLVIGAAGALLLAPASGRETRERLGKLGHLTIDKARKRFETVREFAGDQAHRIERALEEGKEAYHKESARG